LRRKEGRQTHLSVCDGDDVGGNVGGHVAGLGLDNGEGSEGTATEVVVHLGGSFKQAGVKVEHVTGVGLTTGGTTQQQGHLTVGHSLHNGRGKRWFICFLYLIKKKYIHTYMTLVHIDKIN
jgi:hypothetical protein